MLGRYLARGLAGSTDSLEAERWLMRAKAAGLAEAQLELYQLSRAASVPSLLTTAG
jgi:TPR repeat protein